MVIADGDVTPMGQRIQVAVGQPITFEITSDVPGILHVHSDAGEEFSFESGTSTHEVTIDRPGVVEVELHDPPITVVQLEAR